MWTRNRSGWRAMPGRSFKVDPLPKAQPYNVPARSVTPTYDGTGQAVHPSVLDFYHHLPAQGEWQGFRYWMAMTPYAYANDRLENPSILASHDGLTWEVPVGVTNPLVPAPPSPGFGSDTHLAYDPDEDELVIWYRQTLDTVTHTHHVIRSSDGVTWTSPVNVGLPDGGIQQLSPALCRVATGDWRVFALQRTDLVTFSMWQAAAPEGPWGAAQTCTGLAPILNPWHLDVLYYAGKFWMLVDRGPHYLGRPDGFRVAISTDGLAWSSSPFQAMSKGGAGDWDEQQLYRASIQPHEDGQRFRMWYSASSAANEWNTGASAILRSEWPPA